MFQQWLQKFDWFLVLITTFCLSLGLLMIYSTTINATSSSTGKGAFPQQLIYCFIGVLVMFTLYLFDYRQLKGSTIILYSLSFISLAYLFMLGEFHGGINRWIRIGINIQPSEVAKVTLVLFLAEYFDRHQQTIKKPTTIIVSLLATLVPAFLIFKQPDLGSALVLVAIWLIMAPIAGVPLKYYAGALGTALVASPFFWIFLMRDYQKNRILSLINPDLYPNYQVSQAKIAIGSGGFFGTGIGQGTQTQLQFLPVRHTDFIFSSIAEELGFVGSIVLLVAFAMLLLHLLLISRRAQDNFGALVCIGLFSMLGFQIIENIGMNLGLLPVTGIPLPFISYGGTSLVISLLCIGLALSISAKKLSTSDEQEQSD